MVYCLLVYDISCHQPRSPRRGRARSTSSMNDEFTGHYGNKPGRVRNRFPMRWGNCIKKRRVQRSREDLQLRLEIFSQSRVLIGQRAAGSFPDSLHPHPSGTLDGHSGVESSNPQIMRRLISNKSACNLETQARTVERVASHVFRVEPNVFGLSGVQSHRFHRLTTSHRPHPGGGSLLRNYLRRRRRACGSP